MRLKREWCVRFRGFRAMRAAMLCMWFAIAVLPIGARAATCEGDKMLVTLPAIKVASDASGRGYTQATFTVAGGLLWHGSALLLPQPLGETMGATAENDAGHVLGVVGMDGEVFVAGLPDQQGHLGYAGAPIGSRRAGWATHCQNRRLMGLILLPKPFADREVTPC